MSQPSTWRPTSRCVLVQQLANNPQDASNKSAGMVGMSSIDQFTLGDDGVGFIVCVFYLKRLIGTSV